MAAIANSFLLVKVRNISPEGISLILDRPVEPGEVLSLDLVDVATNRCSRTLHVEVVYAIEHPSGDWITGGKFSSRLTADELRQFLEMS